MKSLIALTLVVCALVIPATVIAGQSGNGRPSYGGYSDFMRGPHSRDDPRNRPIDARGVQTRSDNTYTTQQRPDTSGRVQSHYPMPRSLQGSYGIAK